MNQEFEEAKREAFVRANVRWSAHAERPMTELERIAFELGFAEGRVSGGKKIGEIILGDIIK